MQDISIPAAFVHAILLHAPAHGVDCEKALLRCGIQPRVLEDPGARISARCYADLQSLVMREMGDELLGHGARPLRLGSGAALTHWMLHARTLGQALKRYCHFFQILDRELWPQLTMDGGRAVLRYQCLDGRTRPGVYGYELILFGVHRFCCWLTRSNLRLTEVALDYPPPPHQLEYRSIFPGAPVSFATGSTELVFERAQLQSPVQRSVESLQAFLKHPQHNLLLGGRYFDSWIARTRAALRENLAHMPTLVETADRLGLSPRQLRRRLDDEGIGYGELKEQLRRDVAMECLEAGDFSIEETAFRAGFAEASTFIRAFRKWTGHTPHAYRRNYYRSASRSR